MGVKTIWELCLFEIRPFGSLWRLQIGIFTFLTERDWSQKVVMATALSVSFCFFFWQALKYDTIGKKVFKIYNGKE